MPARTLAARDIAHVIHPVTAPKDIAASGPRIITEGDGWWITDDHGNRLIDGFAGLWCVAVGHGRPEIIDAVQRQMSTLEYSTTFHGQSHPRAIELAERLASLFPAEHQMNHVMFSSGGSEANETNFKLARMYWALKGEDRRRPSWPTITATTASRSPPCRRQASCRCTGISGPRHRDSPTSRLPTATAVTWGRPSPSAGWRARTR